MSHVKISQTEPGKASLVIDGFDLSMAASSVTFHTDGGSTSVTVNLVVPESVEVDLTDAKVSVQDLAKALRWELA